MRGILLFLLLISCTNTNAQVDTTNLVLNGGFEKILRCPDDYDEIEFAYHWTPVDTTTLAPRGAAELCNACATYTSGVSIPAGISYNHYPRSGNGMIHMQMYFNEYYTQPYLRDYIQGRLSKPLEAGKTYCVTFYTALTVRSGYAINHIGAYLDDGSIDSGQDSLSCAAPQTAFHPQVFTDTVIWDSLNFSKIQGFITGTGNETYITIGNFFDKAHTLAYPFYPYYGSVSWYLIDDVSVVPSTMVAYAGPDGYVSPGSDSVFVGCHQDGLPSTWYILGNTTPITFAGGFKTHPDTTTTYVVMLDLCNHVSYDTVVVYAEAARVGNLNYSNENIHLFPNPTTTSLTIQSTNQPINQLTITNLLGQVTYTHEYNTEKVQIDVADLPKGMYLIRINGSEVRKFVKR
jgi:Secretion system C-terminal sorting domain